MIIEIESMEVKIAKINADIIQMKTDILKMKSNQLGTILVMVNIETRILQLKSEILN